MTRVSGDVGSSLIRLATCIAMSSLGGLPSRITYLCGSHAYLTLLRDMASMVLENHLVLVALERSWATCGRSGGGGCCGGRSPSPIGFLRRPLTSMTPMLATVVPPFWALACWGDYVYQVETGGLLPTIWIVGAGMQSPTVHAKSQLGSHRDVFLGGFFRCLAGLGVGFGMAVWMQRLAETGSIRTVGLSTPKALTVNAAFLVVLFSTGAWAPLTNLVNCYFAIFVLGRTPPGSGSSLSGATSVGVGSTRRMVRSAGVAVGVASNPDKKSDMPGDSSSSRPNVILVVHESLSGAALHSNRGRQAAPFYHGKMRTNPDVYQFQKARTVSGMTPIATPGLLTGLVPYTNRGVDLVRAASLAADFKSVGYDTAAFVSYGTDWAGSFWSILSDLLVPGFDDVFEPKSTGDPLVNEYGMDDRLLVGHLERWVQERVRSRGGGMSDDNATTSTPSPTLARYENETRPKKGERGSAEIDSNKPFFAVLVLNNNHYPYLCHGEYSGYPASTGRRALLEIPRGNFLKERRKDPWHFENKEIAQYYSSIRTMDETLQDLFDTLDGMGILNNTILMGAGDHGDTPGKMKRLADVDALILDIPLWMHIPKDLLPRRAYHHQENLANTSSSMKGDIQDGDGRGRRGTFLYDNVDRGVSVLDIIPTLRDVLGTGPLFTQEEEGECVVGMSLLSQHIPVDRLMMSWQGGPLHEDHAIGIFSTATDALVFYENDPTKSKIIEYNFGDQHPFSALPEHILGDDDSENELFKRWEGILKEQGLFDHGLIKARMSHLMNAFHYSNDTKLT